MLSFSAPAFIESVYDVCKTNLVIHNMQLGKNMDRKTAKYHSDVSKHVLKRPILRTYYYDKKQIKSNATLCLSFITFYLMF